MFPTEIQSPILILGAGISGPALAQALLKTNIPFRIYERDTHFNLRAQGYRVRIIGSGIEALQSLLPPPLYSQLEASCAINAHGGTGPGAKLDALTAEHIEMSGASGPVGPSTGVPGHATMQKPQGGANLVPLNADRMVLRSVLMLGLEKHVEFGKDFSKYTISPSGITLHFSDGSEAHGSLLVGADGAGSKVRKQFVPQLSTVDTEGRFFYGKSTLTPRLEKSLNKNCLEGLSVIQDRSGHDPITLILEPVRFKSNAFRKDLPPDDIYWALFARKGFQGTTDAQTLANPNFDSAHLASKITSQSHPSFHPLFTNQDAAQTSLLRILSAPPNIPLWQPSNRVTIIGDAAHVMTPTSGVGATCALRDAALLARVLGGGGVSEEGVGRGEGVSEEAVGRCEAFMRKIAREGIERSEGNGNVVFGMKPFGELERVDV